MAESVKTRTVADVMSSPAVTATPDETVAVGDAVWDVEAADAAGIRTVAVLTGGAFGEEELKEAGAVAVYQDCAALLDSDFPE